LQEKVNLYILALFFKSALIEYGLNLTLEVIKGAFKLDVLIAASLLEGVIIADLLGVLITALCVLLNNKAILFKAISSFF